MSAPCSTGGADASKKSNGGGRFGGNDMQEHLARMGKQLAEIQAQHQQLFGGKHPDRDQLAKATSRYLTGRTVDSLSDSGQGQSDVSTPERRLHRSPSSPPGNRCLGVNENSDASSSLHSRKQARSLTESTAESARRSLQWEQQQHNDLAVPSNSAHTLASASTYTAGSVSTASSAWASQHTTPTSRFAIEAGMETAARSPDSMSSQPSTVSITAKRLANVQAYAVHATGARKRTTSSHAASIQSEVRARSPSSPPHDEEAEACDAKAAVAEAAGVLLEDEAPEEASAGECSGKTGMNAGDSSEVCVYKYRRGRAGSQSSDSDTESNAESIPEEPQLQQQQSDLEFTFGNRVQDSVEFPAVFTRQTGSPSHSDDAACSMNEEAGSGSSCSFSSSFSPGLASSMGASQLGSHLSRTLDISLSPGKLEPALRHDTAAAGQEGHYSLSLGPLDPIRTQAPAIISEDAQGSGAQQPTHTQATGVNREVEGVSGLPPLPPGLRRSTVDPSLFAVASPVRTMGLTAGFAMDDSVLFGSPVMRDAYQQQAAPLHPSDTASAPWQSPGSRSQNVRASFTAEPRVVVYEPSRYQESPEEALATARHSLGQPAESEAATAQNLQQQQQQLWQAQSPNMVPLPQMPTPVAWKAGAASPMAKAAAQHAAAPAPASILPFASSTPAASPTIGLPSALFGNLGMQAGYLGVQHSPYAAAPYVNIPPTPATEAQQAMKQPSALAPPFLSALAMAGGAQRRLHPAMDAAQSAAADAAFPEELAASPSKADCVEAGVQTEAVTAALRRGSEESAGAQVSRIPHAPGVDVDVLLQVATDADNSQVTRQPSTSSAPSASAAAATPPPSKHEHAASPDSSPSHPAIDKLNLLKLRRQQQQQRQQQQGSAPEPGTSSGEGAHTGETSPRRVPSARASNTSTHSPPRRTHMGRATSSPHRESRSGGGSSSPGAARTSSRTHENVFSPLTLELRPEGGRLSGGAQRRRASHVIDDDDYLPSTSLHVLSPDSVLANLPGVPPGVPVLLPGQQLPLAVPAHLPRQELTLGHGVTGLSTSFSPGDLLAVAAALPGSGAGVGMAAPAAHAPPTAFGAPPGQDKYVPQWAWPPGGVAAPMMGSSYDVSGSPQYGSMDAYRSSEGSLGRRRRTAEDAPLMVSPLVGGWGDSSSQKAEHEARNSRPSTSHNMGASHTAHASGAHRASTPTRSVGAPSQPHPPGGAAPPVPPAAPAASQPAPASGEAAPGSQAASSRTAALMRLKQKRLQQVVANAGTSESAAAVAAAAAVQSALPAPGSSIKEFSLRRRAEAGGTAARMDAGIEQASVAAPIPRTGPASAAGQGAGFAADGQGGAHTEDVDPANTSAQPFLKRRSKKVAGAKLDWSHVKPRTQCRMEDYDRSPTKKPANARPPAPLPTPAYTPAAKRNTGHSSVRKSGQFGSRNTASGSGGGLRGSSGWKPGGRSPPSAKDRAKANSKVAARGTAHRIIPGLDYEVQRYTGITTFSNVGDLGAGGGVGGGSGGMYASPAKQGIAMHGGDTPSSPLDDLLKHVNSLLRDFDTRFPGGKPSNG